MVSGFLTQLEKKYKGQLDEKAHQYIYYATDGAKRMRKIISDLLEYSKVSSNDYDLVSIDINGLIENAVQLNRSTIEEMQAEIVWDRMPDIQAAMIPLQKVFQNLIGNALKYHAIDRIPKIVISSKEIPGFWQFSIADNGIGIAPEFYDKIFILFQRLHLKEEYSGTGVGLAICKKVIENFDGKVWVESLTGHGSTFHFTIPQKNITKEPVNLFALPTDATAVFI